MRTPSRTRTSWAVWVRDEDRIEQARQSLEHFRVDPEDSRYRGVERDAEVIRREELQRRMSAQKNVVEMRGRWLQPTIRQDSPHDDGDRAVGRRHGLR